MRDLLAGTARFACTLFIAILASSLAAATAGDDHAPNYRWRNVEIVGGGYVPGVVFNESEPGLVYARTDIGGAYRWQPQLNRWQPLLDWVGADEWGLTGVDSIATDPVDPDRVYVLAGTYTNSFDPNNGAILRSQDRGHTWERTPLPFKSGGNMPGRNMGERLVIDPNDHRILFLGTRSGNGLWMSTDYAQSWKRVTSFPAVGSYAPDPSDSSGYSSDPIGVTWVTFDKRTGKPGQATQTIYVGVADLGTSIYRSSDGGVSWEALPGQPTSPAFMPHHGVLASNGILYITYNNNAGPYDGSLGDVWKYDTASGAWTKISPDPSSSTQVLFGYGGLAVDAQNPNVVMVAALNEWWPDAIIWRSTDAGATWKAIWEWGPWPTRILHYTQDISAAPWLTFNATPSLPVIAPQLGWMIGDLKIDPFDSNHMLYGTGATLYGSDDLTSWDAGNPITISVQARGIEETSVQDLISPPQGAHLLSALGDIAGFRHDDLNVVPNKMYDNPITGTTTSLDFAELAPQRIARVGSGGSNIGFSSDGGTTWTPGTSAAGESAGVVALSADGTSAVWSPANAVVSYSLDNGQSWTASSGVPAGAHVGSDRALASRFYAYANGVFYVSMNRGVTFTTTGAAGLPASGVKFKAVAGRPGEIWLAAGTGGLWRTRNAGVTFSKLTNVQEADNIGFGLSQRKDGYPALYTSAKIAGVRGIFRSDDAGQHWVRINDDRHQYATTNAAITGDPRVYGRVYISTNGRGVIYGEPTDAQGHQ
jgi:xyloglucan-specific exo-beta-1,4-glucanase